MGFNLPSPTGSNPSAELKAFQSTACAMVPCKLSGFISVALPRTGKPRCSLWNRSHSHRAPMRNVSSFAIGRCRSCCLMSVERDYGADSTDAMRSRLEGLIGHSQGGSESHREKDFNGKALRRVMKERFTVEYDIQPTVRGKFVYLHIMWRYFEQLSFYMDEQQWDEHMEAVADLLKKWGAVDYFCDYINKVKKRPVVGIALNVRIPWISQGSPHFPSTGARKD